MIMGTASGEASTLLTILGVPADPVSAPIEDFNMHHCRNRTKCILTCITSVYRYRTGRGSVAACVLLPAYGGVGLRLLARVDHINEDRTILDYVRRVNPARSVLMWPRQDADAGACFVTRVKPHQLDVNQEHFCSGLEEDRVSQRLPVTVIVASVERFEGRVEVFPRRSARVSSGEKVRNRRDRRSLAGSHKFWRFICEGD